jgi:uncharacterized protein (DUF427 family)
LDIPSLHLHLKVKLATAKDELKDHYYDHAICLLWNVLYHKDRNMGKKQIRITHRLSGEMLAEGPVGWGITPFEGNYYISQKYLRTEGFKANFVPGICFYKFLYVWLDYRWGDDNVSKFIGWKYWLPNPAMPFIWFRVAVPAHHPGLLIEEFEPEIIVEEVTLH